MNEDIEKSEETEDFETIELIDSFGHVYNTTGRISEGGQGAVYSTNDSSVVVKLVFDNPKDKNIMTNENTSEKEINERNEEFYKQFKLPLPKNANITFPFSTLKNAVGYTMRLMEDMEPFEKTFIVNYSGKSKTNYNNTKISQMFAGEPVGEVFMSDYVGVGGIRRRLNAYYLCSGLISKIHSQGLVYCDFSDNNVFISKLDGDYNNDHVWLIDADNINYEEETLKSGYFTPKYGAPEVFAGNGCSFYSDCYAFAVSFFKTLIMNHPFEGLEYQDYDGSAEDADNALQAGQFAYIFDENNQSNTIDGILPVIAENSLDENIKVLFERTFIDGKIDFRKRPSMMEWTDNISKALDHQLVCSECKLPYINRSDVCTCLWCDNKNNVIRITSYTWENRKIREFRREYTEGDSLIVPLRLIKGANALKPREKLLYISIGDDTITLKAINDDYPVYIGATGQRVFGSYEILKSKFSQDDKKVSIYTDDISENIRYRLEVEIL